MPHGKPANTPCIHLDDQYRCQIFGKPERPLVCDQFRAQADVCGTSRDEALILLTSLEQATSVGVG